MYLIFNLQNYPTSRLHNFNDIIRSIMHFIQMLIKWHCLYFVVFLHGGGGTVGAGCSHACQLSLNLIQPLFSFDQDMRVKNLSYKLSLLIVLNSHQRPCNSCSRLTRRRELRKLSYKLSLVNSHQLSSTLMKLLV